jgi:hypothetical protein
VGKDFLGRLWETIGRSDGGETPRVGGCDSPCDLVLEKGNQRRNKRWKVGTLAP